MSKKFIIKDETGKTFEITEEKLDAEEPVVEPAPEVKDAELLPEEIAALKELAKHSADLIALLTPKAEEPIVDEECEEPIVDADEEAEEKVVDTTESVGSIEKKATKDSVSIDSEIEVANAWAKRFSDAYRKGE